MTLLTNNNILEELYIKAIYRAYFNNQDMEYKIVNENIILVRYKYLRHIELLRFTDNKMMNYANTKRHLFKIMNSKYITVEQINDASIHLHFIEQGIGNRIIIFDA